MDNQLTKFTPREVPTIAQLQDDPDKAYKNDQLQKVLHAQPPAVFIKTNKYVKVKNEQNQNVDLQYIPIYHVKFLLTRIFGVYWYTEVIDFKVLFNSIGVQVRLYYQNPTTGEWHHKDGVGAVGCQTDAGSTATDFNALKADAVMKALPAAESYAIKNAAEKIGDVFGGKLQKWDAMEFFPMYKTPPGNESPTPTPAPDQPAATTPAPGPVTAEDFPM